MTSSGVAITGGRVTYSQSFACSLGVFSASGSESVGVASCNPGYTSSGAVCLANAPVSSG